MASSSLNPSERPIQQYNPTADELNASILAILKENESPIQPSSKQIHQIVAKQNPTWKLQERRVAKFVKKQKKLLKAQRKLESTTQSGEEGSTTSNASRTRRLLVNTGSAIRSKTKSVKGALTPKSTVGSRTSKTKVFTFRTKKSDDTTNGSEVVSSPDSKSTVLTPIDSELSKEDAEQPTGRITPEKTEPEVTEVPPVEQVTAETKQLADIYEDDNTGEEQKDCFCAGCTIL